MIYFKLSWTRPNIWFSNYFFPKVNPNRNVQLPHFDQSGNFPKVLRVVLTTTWNLGRVLVSVYYRPLHSCSASSERPINKLINPCFVFLCCVNWMNSGKPFRLRRYRTLLCNKLDNSFFVFVVVFLFSIFFFFSILKLKRNWHALAQCFTVWIFRAF